MYLHCFGIAALLVLMPADRGVSAVPAAAADKDEVVALDIKGLAFGVNRGKFQGPLLITDEKGLEAAWPADKYKGVQEKIKEQVDFRRQQLLYFAWSGSGGDKIPYRVEGDKQKTIIFTYKPGATDDIRAHFHLYAVPRGWLNKVEDK